MKNLYIILFALFFATVFGHASSKTVKYTIKKGETLYTIAHKHHTTIEEVKKINGLKKDEKLKVGRVLKVQKDTYFPNKKVAKKSNKRTNRKLRTALRRHSVSFSGKHHKKRLRKKYVMDDIFFKSLQPSLGFSGFSAKQKKITKLAKTKLGRRYVWGATGKRNTFDCSGLTTYVYRKNGINLPRRAIAQSRVGRRVSRSQLRPGDLIFFDTSKRRRGYVNHVGIYIGNGKFIHASSAKKKVIITSLKKPFYSKRFKVARRVSS